MINIISKFSSKHARLVPFGERELPLLAVRSKKDGFVGEPQGEEADIVEEQLYMSQK